MAARESAAWTIDGLGADGPHPELRDNLRLFGQFVGDWAIDSWWMERNGARVTGTGEVHFGWILDGRAVQDVWINLDGSPPKRIAAGTTIRFYDPRLDAWRVTWINPTSGTVRTFVARQIGDEIVLEGKTADGSPERWIFSQITPRSFRWRSVESDDDGETWRLTEEMSIRRIQPA